MVVGWFQPLGAGGGSVGDSSGAGSLVVGAWMGDWLSVHGRGGALGGVHPPGSCSWPGLSGMGEACAHGRTLVVVLVAIAEGVLVQVAQTHLGPETGMLTGTVFGPYGEHLLAAGGYQYTNGQVGALAHDPAAYGIRGHPAEHAAIGGETLLQVIAHAGAHIGERYAVLPAVGIVGMEVYRCIAQGVDACIAHLVRVEIHTIGTAYHGAQGIIAGVGERQTVRV